MAVPTQGWSSVLGWVLADYPEACHSLSCSWPCCSPWLHPQLPVQATLTSFRGYGFSLYPRFTEHAGIYIVYMSLWVCIYSYASTHMYLLLCCCWRLRVKWHKDKTHKRQTQLRPEEKRSAQANMKFAVYFYIAPPGAEFQGCLTKPFQYSACS